MDAACLKVASAAGVSCSTGMASPAPSGRLLGVHRDLPEAIGPARARHGHPFGTRSLCNNRNVGLCPRRPVEGSMSRRRHRGSAISTTLADQGKPSSISGHDTKSVRYLSIAQRCRDRPPPEPDVETGTWATKPQRSPAVAPLGPRQRSGIAALAGLTWSLRVVPGGARGGDAGVVIPGSTRDPEPSPQMMTRGTRPEKWWRPRLTAPRSATPPDGRRRPPRLGSARPVRRTSGPASRR